MEAQKRNLRARKPLSDCTNTAASSQSSALTPSPVIKSRKPKINCAERNVVNNSTKGESSCTSDFTTHNLPASNPSSDCPPSEAPTPSLRPVSSSNSGTDCEFLEPQSFYSRRRPTNKRKNTEKAVVPLSCSTASKVQTNVVTEKRHGYSGPSQARTVPCKKRQRPTISGEGVSKVEFPRDFIEQQKAYFSEVDAFELPVEVVKSSESE